MKLINFEQIIVSATLRRRDFGIVAILSTSRTFFFNRGKCVQFGQTYEKVPSLNPGQRSLFRSDELVFSRRMVSILVLMESTAAKRSMVSILVSYKNARVVFIFPSQNQISATVTPVSRK